MVSWRTENCRARKREDADERELKLGDRFNQVLIDGDEIGPVFVIDQNIGQADEEALFLIDGVGDAISHRRDEKIPHVGAIHRSNADANFFALWHGSLRPYVEIDQLLRRKNFWRRRNFLYLCLRIFFRRFFNTLDIQPLLYARESRIFHVKMQDSSGATAAAVIRRTLVPCLDLSKSRFLYCPMVRAIVLLVRYLGCLAVVSVSLWGLGCATKTVQYKEDHDRIVRIDAAVERLRRAYVERDRSAFEDLLLPSGQLDPLQRDVQADFSAFRDISLEFAIERMLIDGDTVDVFVHWQGQWRRDESDAGVRQRGHARLQWAGVQSVLLRDVEGDLPFGMHSRAATAEQGSTPRK
jgi:hypothetical protein